MYEFSDDYQGIPLLLRGDSGFAIPDLYKQCEENGIDLYKLRDAFEMGGSAIETKDKQKSSQIL